MPGEAAECKHAYVHGYIWHVIATSFVELNHVALASHTDVCSWHQVSSHRLIWTPHFPIALFSARLSPFISTRYTRGHNHRRGAPARQLGFYLSTLYEGHNSRLQHTAWAFLGR